LKNPESTPEKDMFRYVKLRVIWRKSNSTAKALGGEGEVRVRISL